MAKKQTLIRTKRTRTNTEIEKAIALLEASGYVVHPPPPESEYCKALRTGIKPDIWPPIVMSREELEHFRSQCGIG